MTATADKVEDYNLIEIINNHIQYNAHDVQVSISPLVNQELMDKGISKQILFGIVPRFPKGPLTD